MPYDRHLPGEIMFLDLEDVAEALTWDPDLFRMRTLFHELARKIGWPNPACWVMPTRRRFLVTGDLAETAERAKCHGLTVDSTDRHLRLKDRSADCETEVRLLDHYPPRQALPRWWRTQEPEWAVWYKAWKQAESAGMTPARPRTQAIRSRSYSNSEVASMIDRLTEAGNGRVLPKDLVAMGVPRQQASLAVRRYNGPDLTRLAPDNQGRVTGPQVQDAYRLNETTLGRSVRSGRLKLVGTAGTSNLYEYEQIRALFG